MATTTDVERKYEVPVDFTLPDLTAVRGVAAVGEPAEHRLDATYFDTPGMRLAARQVTLRRRTGGDDAGWHLNRPTAGDGRTETRAPLVDERNIPSDLVDQILPLIGDEQLRPVARVRTRRVGRLLHGADGEVLATLADDVVASEAPGKPAILQHWRELEVELRNGPRQVLDAVDAALRAAGARPARVPSKLAHALAEHNPHSPSPRQTDDGGDRDRGRDRDRDHGHGHGRDDASHDDRGGGDAGHGGGGRRERTRAARTLADYVGRQRDTIIEADPRVRRGDPDAVHDMRVATRRLRTTLRTFRPLLPAARTEPLRGELRWLARVLGAVRDDHVMAERLAGAIAAEPAQLVAGPIAARIEQRLTERGADARGQLVQALDGPRYAALLDELDDLVATGLPARIKRRQLYRRCRKALRRADRRLDRAGDRDARLHDARKAYKRARYAVEVLRSQAGKPARRLGKRLKALQDVLGANQDSIVTSDRLREFGMRAHLDGDNAFTYGLLHARQREARARCRRELPAVRRRARRRKLRRWLGA